MTLIKVDDRRSEQIFSVGITFSDPPSSDVGTANLFVGGDGPYDYRVSTAGLNFLRLQFPPDQQSINISFFINGDALEEDLEAFRIAATPDGFPTFQVPPPFSTDAFPNTEVRILDDDREYSVCLSVCLSVNLSVCHVCLTVCLSVSLSVHLHPFLCQFVCMYICHLPVSLPVCLPLRIYSYSVHQDRL